MALVMKVVLGWNIHFSIWVSALTVGIYVVLGGLFSAIFNEVLQFFLIWLGALLIPILGLIEAGGWSGMVARIQGTLRGRTTPTCGGRWEASLIIRWYPLDRHRFWPWRDRRLWLLDDGLPGGAARSGSQGYARRQAGPHHRLLFQDGCPFHRDPARSARVGPAALIICCLNWPCTWPAQLQRGLAAHVGALLRSRPVGPRHHRPHRGFMSGMAGKSARFHRLGPTISIARIFGRMLRRTLCDHGRISIILGVLISIGTAYLVMEFKSIMELRPGTVQFLHRAANRTVLLGMLWKRATPAAGFWGLLAGTVSSISMWVLVRANPKMLTYIALSPNAKDMAENMYRILWVGLICMIVTVVVSLFTRPKPVEELTGLVYGCTELPSEGHLPLWKRPIFWAAAPR